MKLRVLLVLLFSAILLGCLGYQQGANVTQTTAESVRYKEIEVHFYYSPYCPHCIKVEPYVKDLVKKHPDVKFYFCNVYEVMRDNLSACSNKSLMYIYHVRGVPTAIVVYNNTVTVLTGSNKVLELEDVIRCIKECL